MLVERFSRYVYAIATQAFRLREHDAEDVFQEVFARVYERLDQLRDDDAIRPWIAQLTRRLCLDKMRANARVEVSDEEIGEEADETLAQHRGGVGVRQMLGALPEHCREMLDRFFAQDESYRTIGEALDLPRRDDREPDLALSGDSSGNNSRRGKKPSVAAASGGQTP